MEDISVTETEGIAPASKKKVWISEALLTRDALLIAGTILLSAIIISASLATPMSKTSDPAAAAVVPGADDQGTAAAPEATNVTVSLDDDPVLGDKTKAKVAIIEFSDYECPFCQRFHKDTYDQLVKDYVNTGKAILSFRDFPLSFHDPKATEEAATASCVRKEKGDAAYFAFGKALYDNTQSNGQGLPAGKLESLLREAGVDPVKIAACAQTQEVQEEIKKDIADGTTAGVTGTPSFIIGTVDKNGQVTGERVVGALPYAQFKATLDKYVK
ncbi:MAG: thioredoxin domain-containing protein [Candidatus Moraniibacteriota bacterium]